MTDYTELKRLAEAAQYENCEFQHELVAATKAFFVGCIPEQILALIAENDRLERLALDAVNAEFSVNTDIESMCAERDQLKAENEALREEIEHSKTNPLYSTRANSRRYVWLRDNHIGDNPEAINLECGPWPGLNSAIDAAMGKGKQS